MKCLHLICNSHIDPVWQWGWDEGMSATLSTFQSAVNLAKEFDYIFCHNEAVLYKAVEQYAPELFEEIRRLAAQGKWHIMGGWYLQPDCNMPSGESIVRQCMMGHRYFEEKFGVWPTTAVNMDPFGHNRGLVQILAKCGQDSYLCVRPFAGQMAWPVEYNGKNQPNYERFRWIGYDDKSSLLVQKSFSYMCFYGRGGQRIPEVHHDTSGYDYSLLTWGVGNHGGGPSRKDLTEIRKKMESGLPYAVVHSTPEAYFSDAKEEINQEYRHSLLMFSPGCYTSLIEVKQAHIALENELYRAEKICALAELKGLCAYPTEQLESAAEDMLLAEFHDVLPGTCTRPVESFALTTLAAGRQKAQSAFSKAFHRLMLEQPVAKEGEYPVVVFNPYPYPLTATVECDVQAVGDHPFEDFAPDEKYVYRVQYKGQELPFQLTKPAVNFNERVSYRKKIVFTAELEPFCLNRFSVYIEKGKYDNRYETEPRDFPDMFRSYAAPQGYTYEDAYKRVVIGASGLLESYRIDGREYLQGGAFAPIMYTDTGDSWAMSDEQRVRLGRDPQPFSLIGEGSGVFSGMAPIQVIEDGPIYAQIEAFFTKADSKVKLSYKIYKDRPDVDVDVSVFFNERERLVKLHIPTAVDGRYIGQGMFGAEELFMDGRECVSQRFTALRQKDDTCLAFLNSSIYGNDFHDGTVALTLVRGAGYCSHPVGADVLPKLRYSEIMDQGQHDYHFRLTVCGENELEKNAAEFSQPPFAVNGFPTCSQYAESPKEVSFRLSNPNIGMPAFKKSSNEDGYILRLINNSEREQTATVTLNGAQIDLVFGKYEVKTLRYADGVFTALDRMEI